TLYGLAALSIGGSLGLALAGLLIDWIGPAALFAVEAGVALLALPPAWRLYRLMEAGASESPATGR
ncbi:MAG: hypothetical protein V3R77_02225, partial [Candidatus Binatia bacterium]